MNVSFFFHVINRSCSSTKTEICRYYESPTGCVRGNKCLFSHAREELREIKQATQKIHSPSERNLQRKVFVGGLPPSVDSG